MTTDKEMTEKERSRAIASIALIIIGLLAGAMLTDYHRNQIEKIYYDVDKTVSCIKGCQFLTQDNLGIINRSTAENRIDEYSSCTRLCEEEYPFCQNKNIFNRRECP